ncbi:hypothetical protein EVAR_8025_1 [Eumeta japonica]|uniref:Uncharacterized protein n=1 Tax=Eumeta variegata TaxID=151549 RepID=A0A4C1TJP4_EUMVA|nr:hypothetical protein EVAR_8025_1 [Eumeta japonica]
MGPTSAVARGLTRSRGGERARSAARSWGGSTDEFIKIFVKWDMNAQSYPISLKLTETRTVDPNRHPERGGRGRLKDEQRPKRAKLDTLCTNHFKEKVSRIEEEIFREIEEIEKSTPENAKKSASSTKSSPDVMMLTSRIGPPENNFVDNTKSEQKPEMENITNRRKRGKPKKGEEKNSSEQICQSPVKKRISKQLTRESEDEIIVNEEKLQLVEDIAETSRQPTPRKLTNIRRNKALQRKQLLIDSDDSTVGYKFPSPERETLPIPINKTGRPRSLEKVKKTYNSKNPTQNCSSAMLLNESSQISTESSYGYQDSDCSPGLILKKRKIKIPTCKSKLKFEARRKSFRRHKFKCYSSTSESNLSSFSISLRKSNDSSLDTEMYRTDSYQLLRTKKDKPSFKASLQKIIEVTPPVDEFMKELNTLNLSPAPQTVTEIDQNINSIPESDGSKDTSKTKTDVGNSSNISLPPSPELSIVENISIEKSEIIHTDVPLIFNEPQASRSPNDISLHMSIISKEIHSSEPLMGQDFDFITDHVEVCLNEDNIDMRKNQDYTMTSTNNTVQMKSLQSPNLATTVSDSLLNEIRKVNIDDDSDTLDQKLNNLFLESAKKNDKSKGKSKKYDAKKTPTLASGLIEEKEKTKSRKRCSTPHKKTTKKTSMLATVEPVIEEHMEYCAPKPRKSCPPSILLNNQQIVTEDAIPVNFNRGAKKRKQKEILKVKILKPIKKYKLSLHSDSGINDSETGVFESGLNDSVDLIHNHSDTCLNTHDCLQNDSVVINENSSQGVISLSSDTSQADESGLDGSQENLKKGLNPDWFSSDAQDGSVSSNVDKLEFYDSFIEHGGTPRTLTAGNLPYGPYVGNNRAASGPLSLAIFIRGVDKELTVTEELLALQPLKGTTTREDIFNEVQKAQMLSGNSYHFTTLSAYENIAYAKYAEELKLLSKQLSNRFSNLKNMEDCFNLFASPTKIKLGDIGSSSEAIQKTISTMGKQASSITNSPLSYSSLVTEDLSDGRPASGVSEWYLLSEDDCTNTNLESVQKVNYGSYLEKLFPVVCAFPDLSTITEASREADVRKDAKCKSNNTSNCHHQLNKTDNSIPNEESYTCHIN